MPLASLNKKPTFIFASCEKFVRFVFLRSPLGDYSVGALARLSYP